jgi:hypothetical protein
MHGRGTSRVIPNERLGGTQRTKFSRGRQEMHMRHVKCVDSGARGFGFLLGLRFGAQGSRRLRRGLVFATLPDVAAGIACAITLV